eukprot:PhM_4_TR12146/c0_g1_i1/m.78953
MQGPPRNFLSQFKIVPPALHPYVQQLRDYTCERVPWIQSFWHRVDLHRTWSHVDVTFQRHAWERDLRMFEILEVQTLEKIESDKRSELRSIKVRTTAEQAYFNEKMSELKEIEDQLLDRRQQLKTYRKSFSDMIALQEQVLKDKKELEFVTSLVPLPYYMFAILSSIVGLFFLLRQPVKRRIVALKSEVDQMQASIDDVKGTLVLIKEIILTNNNVRNGGSVETPILVVNAEVQTERMSEATNHKVLSETLQWLEGVHPALPTAFLVLAGNFASKVFIWTLMKICSIVHF